MLPLPPNAPDTSPEERSRIAAQRAKATDKRLEKAVAVGVAALSGLARVAPNTAAIVLHSLSGIDVRKSGRAKITPFAKLWILPQPFGIIPPGVYGLSPGYLRDFAPFLPDSEYLHTVDDDHPSMVAFRRKKLARAALTPGNTTIGAGSSTEAITLMADKGWFHKIAHAVRGVRRWPGDLNHWFNAQLRGPGGNGPILEFIQGESAITGAIPPAAPDPGPEVVAVPPALIPDAVAVAPDVVAKKTNTVAAVTLAPNAKVRRRRHVDIVLASRALAHRHRAGTLQALAMAGKPVTKVSK